MRDARVGRVVARPDRPAELGGQAVDPASEREAHVEAASASVCGVDGAGDDDRHEVRAVLAHPGEMRAVRAEQAPGLLDHAVEDDLRLAQGGDPGGDLAQRPLGLGALGDRGLRPLELADEVRVGHGDGRLVGQAAEDRGVHLVECVPVAAVDLDRAERPLVADDRRDDEVADAGRPAPARRSRPCG